METVPGPHGAVTARSATTREGSGRAAAGRPGEVEEKEGAADHVADAREETSGPQYSCFSRNNRATATT